MPTVFLIAMRRVESAVAGRWISAAKRLAIGLPFLILCLAACAPPQQVRPPTELIAVKAGPEANLDELARRYLGKSTRKWIIKDFNQINSVSEGQLVLIPRRNYRPGGLAPDGFQVVPVLVYPDLAAVKSEKASRIVDRFQRQMQFLQTEGYHVVDLQHLMAFMAFEATLPPKAVVLTFDGQSRLFYDLIFPILKTHQLPGTLFINPAAVGAEAMVEWPQLREMTESVLSIQCRFPDKLAAPLKPLHFPDRSRLEEIVAALGRDRQEIESRLGQPCRYLAYPEGEVTPLMVMLSEKAGFRGGFNRMGGSNPFYRNPFASHRQPVDWSADIDGFRKHLAVFEPEVLR
jgi:peptidoglycan/xylan/chitin deacetylase (PgdA/CDA1 family)